MGRRKMPNPKDLVDYNHAVAGHAGTLCDPDGTLFVKPCTQQEIDFYESARGQHQEFYKWMPRHLGTLRLNETSEISDVNVQLGEVAALMSEHMKEEVVEFAHSHHLPPTDPPTGTATPTAATEPIQPVSEIATPWAPGKNRKLTTEISIVLDNASYGFEAPNIMDCKLGLRLWADDAPPEKKKRFDRIAQETTHKTHGFRVAGMRTYKGSEDPEELDEEGYLKYDKDWGRLSVTPENVIDSIRRFLYNPAAGIDDDDAALVCELFVADLVEIEKMLAAEESRMYSASLLFVCEGDGEALSVAIREAKAAAAAAEAAAKAAARAAAVAAVVERTAVVEGGRARKAAKTGAHSSPGWVSNNRVDSGIDMGEDEEALYEDEKAAGGAVVFAADGVLFSGDDSDSEDDSSDSDEDYEDGQQPNGAKAKKAKKDKFKKIYSLRLIDFAHAEWVPGQGPDENVLLGVRSLIEIFREMPKRTAELRLAAERPAVKSATLAEQPVGSK